MPWSTWKRLLEIKKKDNLFLPTANAYLFLTILRVCDWSGHIFGASASPRSLTKKRAMSASSTFDGGQHDTKYVTFDLLVRAAFVADEIWGFMLEPARLYVFFVIPCSITYIPWYLVLLYDTWYVRTTAPHGRAPIRRAACGTAWRCAVVLSVAALSRAANT